MVLGWPAGLVAMKVVRRTLGVGVADVVGAVVGGGVEAVFGERGRGRGVVVAVIGVEVGVGVGVGVVDCGVGIADCGVLDGERVERLEEGRRGVVEIGERVVVAGVELLVKGVRRGWPSVCWEMARGWKRAVVKRGRRRRRVVVVRRVGGIFVVGGSGEESGGRVW